MANFIIGYIAGMVITFFIFVFFQNVGNKRSERNKWNL
nr:MAG TPA: Ellis van Creveld protein 2 like protein [Caudoviricetes sp.]